MSTSFAEKWSNRFLRYRGSKYPSVDTRDAWCEELSEQTVQCGWIRVVLTQWQQAPLRTLQDAHSCVRWLDMYTAHPSFVKTRSQLDVGGGIQFWFSHQEDLACFRICCFDPIINIRCLSPVQAQQDWRLHWSAHPRVYFL